jgi:hypothetical protein
MNYNNNDKTDVKVLFENMNFDKKHKLNLAGDKLIDIEAIEQGITCEQLEQWNIPVCFYETQITLHGKYSVNSQRVGGYKNVIINKNGSIGVKYPVIDFEKKKTISNYIKHCNWITRHNSICLYFFQYKHITEENYQSVIDSYMEIKNRIDTNLFTGKIEVSTFKIPMYGLFAEIALSIDIIKQENVSPLIEQIANKTIVELDQIIADKKAVEKAESEARQAKWKAEEAEQIEKNKQIYAELVNIELTNMDKLNQYYVRLELTSSYNPITVYLVTKLETAKQGIKVKLESGKSIAACIERIKKDYCKSKMLDKGKFIKGRPINPDNYITTL